MTATTGSLRLRILGATRWVIAGSAGMHLVRFVGNLVVTRLLAPEMFGLMAIATTVSVIIAMLSDVGLRPATIRSTRGSDPAFLDTVWALQIIRGILLWLVSIAVAMALAYANHRGWLRSDSTYANPSLPALIIAAGFSSVIIGFASTLSLSAIRRFDTKLPLKLDLVSTIVGILTMIAVARWSHSVWSLVIGTYASTVCGVFLSHWFMPKPKHRFRVESKALAEILSFGKWLVLSSAITVFASNGDRLLLGAFADPRSLGLYAIAFSLVGALSLILGQVMESVLLPAFCELARTDPTRLPGAYFRLRRRLDPVILAISGMLFTSAGLLVAVLYDPRYGEVARVLQILALGLVVERFTLAQHAYLAIGKPSYLVVINTVRLVSIYTLLPLGFWIGGFYGAVIAVALRDLPIVPVIFFFNSKHQLNNAKLEIGLLAFWPVGFVLGLLLESAVHAMRNL